MRKQNRITNFRFALARLLVFLAAVVALCLLALIACRADQSAWQIRVMVVVFPLGLVIAAGYALAIAAWWIELGREGLRVRYLLGARDYPWPEVLVVKPVRVDFAGGLTRLFRQRYVEFTVVKRRKIIVYVSKRDMPALVAGAGPRWPDGQIERDMKRQRFSIPSAILLAVVLLLLAAMVLSLFLHA